MREVGPPSRAGAPRIEELLLCCTGSSALVGLTDILSLFFIRNIASRINLVCTRSALSFFDFDKLEADTRINVFRTIEGLEGRCGRTHTDIARASQIAVVVPATANIVGKLANGIVDDPVTTILSVYDRPIVVFPAVHPVTFRKRFFSRNLAQLKEDGYVVIGPVKGNSLTDNIRYNEYGAMPGPERIVALIERAAREGVDALKTVALR